MLNIAGKHFTSRLFCGTGKFACDTTMQAALRASATELVTLAVKRHSLSAEAPDHTLTILRSLNVSLLPNTSGARTADEAIFAARLAREVLHTHWVKLEIHPNAHHLLPDPIETLIAAEQLVKDGFVVLPYCPADPILCKRLEDVGCAAVMPLGAPIGSNQGLQTAGFLSLIISDASVPVIIDAGIGRPSHALAAMELGADAVLVNTAIATASQPARMATAFRDAVRAGEVAYKAGCPHATDSAQATSPLTGFLEAPYASCG